MSELRMVWALFHWRADARYLNATPVKVYKTRGGAERAERLAYEKDRTSDLVARAYYVRDEGDNS